MRKFFLLAFIHFLFPSKGIWAQDILYARSCMKTLCSDDYFGRGYVNNGDKIAAQFIRNEFSRLGVSPLVPGYFQQFGFPVVYYPERVEIELDDQVVFAGHDFILNPGCPSVKGNFKVLRLDSMMVDNGSEYNKLLSKNLKSTFLIVDDLKAKKLLHPERVKNILNNGLKAKGLIYENNETLVWSPAMEFASFPILYFKKGIMPALVLKMTLKIEAAHKAHGTQNVLGIIKGKLQPDSFIVFTAHYDHLGMMGKDALFPGANDNASGVAMLLDLARHFVKNPPAYSIVFMAFAGEEIGLLGSYYFVQNPAINLKNICLLLNMDLMSTGDEGLTVVNATVFPALFEDLKMCNNIGHYLPDIAPRGKAQNSDHYYFTEAGVPSFFLYLRGNYHHYHDVEDTYEELTLSKYKETFQLLVDFTQMRMGR